uniref:Ig-like domain-containing protein n=1 Tax=Poecilia reticulata TaxID=8081 RepID=A0A3P9NJ13_POERE
LIICCLSFPPLLTGAHILQAVTGCEVDENMEYSSSFFHLGIDGEDFMTLDINKLAWIPQKSQAVPVKHVWDQDKEGIKQVVNIFTTECPVWLRGSVKASNISYQKSVSLLQKSPSSQVSCHATGFHPDRAVLFWRREEEEIHEGVEHGEILQNNDGTFQMTVGLSVSVIPPKDWRKYDCVFQLYGVSEDIVTPLNKEAIRTNWEHSSNVVVPITASLLFVVIIAITAYIVYKRKKGKKQKETF